MKKYRLVEKARADFSRLLTADPASAAKLFLERTNPTKWEQQALLSHPPQQGVAILKVLLKGGCNDRLLSDLCRQIAMRNVDAETTLVFRMLLEQSPVRSTVVEGFAAGLSRKRSSLTQLAAGLSIEDQQKLTRFFADSVAALKSGGEQEKRQAIRVLFFGENRVAKQPLLNAASGDESATVRIAAIEALGRFHDPTTSRQLLESFSAETPGIQRAIVRSCVGNQEAARVLMDEVVGKRIPASSIDAASQRVLRRYKEPGLKKAVAQAMAALIPADRKEVLARYADCVKLNSSASRGRVVFEKNCATCHRVGTLGIDIAPDIADSRSKTPEYLLMHILDPNRAVDANYFSYSAITDEGKVVTGIIASETASSVTLKQAEGKVTTLLRANIDELKNNGISLMPVGLEKAINKQQMADLISFIKNWRYVDGDIPIDLR